MTNSCHCDVHIGCVVLVLIIPINKNPSDVCIPSTDDTAIQLSCSFSSYAVLCPHRHLVKIGHHCTFNEAIDAVAICCLGDLASVPPTYWTVLR